MDFALLQKVRSEIATREKEEEEGIEIEPPEDDNDEGQAAKKKLERIRKEAALAGKDADPDLAKKVKEEAKDLDPVQKLQYECRTNMAKGLVRYGKILY